MKNAKCFRKKAIIEITELFKRLISYTSNLNIIKLIVITILFAFCVTGRTFAEMTGYENFKFSGEKRTAFMTPKKDKTWETKLLNESAGRIFFNFAPSQFRLDKPKDESEREIGIIGYFGVAEGPQKGKYFVDSSDHIELTKLKEIKEFNYEFEGTTDQGLRAEGYLRLNSRDFPSKWEFKIKALTPDGVVFYEISEVKSDWAKKIIEANPNIDFGPLEKETANSEIANS